MMMHKVISGRKILSNRRLSEQKDIEFRGTTYTIGFSRYEDDFNPAEVFIHCHKLATHADHDSRDIAVSLSIAIQYGVPLKVLADAVCRNEDGSPIGLAGAVLDFLINEVPALDNVTEMKNDARLAG